MGKLLMILSVALVAYLYWMLFQQIQEDVNSLENSLGLLTQSQDRIVNIISDGVEDFFKEVDRRYLNPIGLYDWVRPSNDYRRVCKSNSS